MSSYYQGRQALCQVLYNALPKKFVDGEVTVRLPKPSMTSTMPIQPGSTADTVEHLQNAEAMFLQMVMGLWLGKAHGALAKL
jgi:hypothetical protein